MAKPSPLFRKWRDRIESGTFTKSEVNAWCGRSGIAEAAHTGRPRHVTTTMTVGEMSDLDEMLYRRGGVMLTHEHAAQGMAWALKLPRKTQELFPTGYLEACEAQTVDYRFIGGHCEELLLGSVAVTPMYEVQFRLGVCVDRFRYSFVGWRSGGAGLWIGVA